MVLESTSATNEVIYSTNKGYLSNYHGTDILLDARVKDMSKTLRILQYQERKIFCQASYISLIFFLVQ